MTDSSAIILFYSGIGLSAFFTAALNQARIRIKGQLNPPTLRRLLTWLLISAVLGCLVGATAEPLEQQGYQWWCESVDCQASGWLAAGIFLVSLISSRVYSMRRHQTSHLITPSELPSLALYSFWIWDATSTGELMGVLTNTPFGRMFALLPVLIACHAGYLWWHQKPRNPEDDLSIQNQPRSSHS